MSRELAIQELIQAADVLRASLPDHWHDDAVTDFDDARETLQKIDSAAKQKCEACGREPALFYNCFRRAEDCPQRAAVTSGEGTP